MNDPYVLASLIIWAAWLAVWHVAGAWRGRRKASAPGLSWGWQLALAFAGFALLFVGSPHVRAPLWRLGPGLGWSSVGLVGAGALFAVWARLHLGALWSGGVVVREDHRLVRSGPYGIVRHPIYTGLIASSFGLAAAKATLPALAGACLVALGFALKARVEERFLGAQLGEADYDAYRREVPMLVPGLRAGSGQARKAG